MIEVKFQTSVAAQPAQSPHPLRDSFVQLDQAEQLRQKGKLDRAKSICEELIRRYPDYMGALHTLGLIYADKKNYRRAFDYLARAAMLNPRSWNTLTALSGVYLRLGANEMAAQTLEQARRIKPRDASVLVTLGEIYLEEREYELARDAYRQALEIESELVPAAMGLGWTYTYLGQDAEAAKIFEDLIARGVRSVDPVLALASLPSSAVSIDLLDQLKNVVREQGEDAAEFTNSIAFARAAVMDKMARHAEAWDQLVPANRSIFSRVREELNHATERQRTSLKRIQGSLLQPTGDQNDNSPLSLFILGPSRSGKTSIERLVATLDGVKRGYENPIVENAIRRTFQNAALLTSDYLENLPDQLLPQCREIYREELAQRAGTARVFTNTHPGRIYDVDRIAGTFSNVRFIFIKRNVEDTVLRMYMRRYNRGNAHAYDLASTREHVVWYHQMIDALAKKLPSVTRVIQYEDMVVDPRGTLGVAIELCGLSTPTGPVPSLGDDRGAASPYRSFMGVT